MPRCDSWKGNIAFGRRACSHIHQLIGMRCAPGPLRSSSELGWSWVHHLHEGRYDCLGGAGREGRPNYRSYCRSNNNQQIGSDATHRNILPIRVVCAVVSLLGVRALRRRDFEHSVPSKRGVQRMCARNQRGGRGLSRPLRLHPCEGMYGVAAGCAGDGSRLYPAPTLLYRTKTEYVSVLRSTRWKMSMTRSFGFPTRFSPGTGLRISMTGGVVSDTQTRDRGYLCLGRQIEERESDRNSGGYRELRIPPPHWGIRYLATRPGPPTPETPATLQLLPDLIRVRVVARPNPL